MAYFGKTIDYRLHYGASPDLIKSSRKLRRDMTHAEKVLWQELTGQSLSGYKFRRQHAIHKYIVDFFCFEKGLVIEVDGSIHNVPEVDEKDGNRTAELERLGLTVIRFTNDEVLAHIDFVLKDIEVALNHY